MVFNKSELHFVNVIWRSRTVGVTPTTPAERMEKKRKQDRRCPEESQSGGTFDV